MFANCGREWGAKTNLFGVRTWIDGELMRLGTVRTGGSMESVGVDCGGFEIELSV